MKRFLLLMILLPSLGGCFTGLENFLIGSMIGMASHAYAKPALDKLAPGEVPPTREEIKKLIQEALSQMQQGNPPALKPPN